jgi:hypothetical protein
MKLNKLSGSNSSSSTITDGGGVWQLAKMCDYFTRARGPRLVIEYSQRYLAE